MLSGLNRFPKPRKKFRDDSFTLPAADVEFKRLNKNHGAIRLPKIGWVHLRGYRPLGGKLRSVTLRRKAGKWHVSAAWDRQALDPPKIEAAPIGIDRGVAVFAATSVGQLIDPLNAFDAIRDKLAKLQRRLARKTRSINVPSLRVRGAGNSPTGIRSRRSCAG